MSQLNPSSFWPLCLVLALSACGSSGGGTQPTPDPASSASSSQSADASRSSEATSSTSSKDSTSSSSTPARPSETSNGDPYCTPAGSDPDGDGWGWEDDQTCVVRNSEADPDRGDFEGCIIGTSSWAYCAVDNTSWGYESGEICVSESFCPANRTTEQAPLAEDLMNQNATAAAQAVYDYFRSIWGSKTLSGQQDLTWKDDTDMYQRVVDDTGKAPAIMGYDFMNYAFNAGSGLMQTEEAVAHWDRGGLVTFCWHWRDPLASGNAAFYSDETDFEIPMVDGQLDTQSDAFNAMQNDIDDIAAELQRLEDEGVVVLWRPLHEASGGWFWWGRARADGVPPAYAQVVLWRHLYERLTNYHGLNNLIWVWNGQSAGWYPGDDYVDIVSTDIYDGAQNYESQLEVYNETAQYPLQTKMVALSENSNIPDPDQIEADGAWWLWFVVWNDGNSEAGVTSENNFWTGEHYNTNEHKSHVYTHENVITLDELPAF